MTAKSPEELKADIEAQIAADHLPTDPPPPMKDLLFDIIDSGKPYNTPDPHLIRLTYPGVPPHNSMVLGEVFAVGVAFPANFAGAQFRCRSTPYAAFYISIRKNNIEVGRISFAAGSNTAVVTSTGGTPVTFAIGDELTFVTQPTLEAIAGIFGVLSGSRT